MNTFLIKLTNIKNGSLSYLSQTTARERIIDGVRMNYTEYIFTDNPLKAYKFYSEAEAQVKITTMRLNQPLVMSELSAEIVRKQTDREVIYLNTRPFTHILRLIRGYKEASKNGKANIRKKLFDNDELYKACEHAIVELDKFRKHCRE